MFRQCLAQSIRLSTRQRFASMKTIARGFATDTATINPANYKSAAPETPLAHYLATDHATSSINHLFHEFAIMVYIILLSAIFALRLDQSQNDIYESILNQVNVLNDINNFKFLNTSRLDQVKIELTNLNRLVDIAETEIKEIERALNKINKTTLLTDSPKLFTISNQILELEGTMASVLNSTDSFDDPQTAFAKSIEFSNTGLEILETFISSEIDKILVSN